MRLMARAAALLVPVMSVVLADAAARERAASAADSGPALPVAPGHACGGQSQLR